MKIIWWSAGVSSTVAALVTPDATPIYIEIDDHDPDNERFAQDVENYLDRPIKRLRSKRFRSVDQVIRACAYVNGPGGAPCTKHLKRTVRSEWERENPGRHTYAWGYDCNEKHRAERIREVVPDHDHVFPLIDAGITKPMAHGMLADTGIRRPSVYDLGFPNANCRGCVKGGMGYWTLVKRVWPEVFALRAATERLVGASCIKGMFLDELDENRGRKLAPIVEDCGVLCGLLQRTEE